MPHFDFHFYRISKAERDSIVPIDPRFAERANNLPSSEFVPPYVKLLGPPGVSAADMAVPKMSVHWVDVRSPELQELLGNHAAHRPAVIGGAGGGLSNDLRGVPMNHPFQTAHPGANAAGEPVIAYVYGPTPPDFAAIAACGFTHVCLDRLAPWCDAAAVAKAKDHGLTAVAFPMARVG